MSPTLYHSTRPMPLEVTQPSTDGITDSQSPSDVSEMTDSVIYKQILETVSQYMGSFDSNNYKRLTTLVQVASQRHRQLKVLYMTRALEVAGLETENAFQDRDIEMLLNQNSEYASLLTQNLRVRNHMERELRKFSKDKSHLQMEKAEAHNPPARINEPAYSSNLTLPPINTSTPGACQLISRSGTNRSSIKHSLPYPMLPPLDSLFPDVNKNLPKDQDDQTSSILELSNKLDIQLDDFVKRSLNDSQKRPRRRDALQQEVLESMGEMMRVKLSDMALQGSVLSAGQTVGNSRAEDGSKEAMSWPENVLDANDQLAYNSELMGQDQKLLSKTCSQHVSLDTRSCEWAIDSNDIAIRLECFTEGSRQRLKRRVSSNDLIANGTFSSPEIGTGRKRRRSDVEELEDENDVKSAEPSSKRRKTDTGANSSCSSPTSISPSTSGSSRVQEQPLVTSQLLQQEQRSVSFDDEGVDGLASDSFLEDIARPVYRYSPEIHELVNQSSASLEYKHIFGNGELSDSESPQPKRKRYRRSVTPYPRQKMSTDDTAENQVLLSELNRRSSLANKSLQKSPSKAFQNRRRSWPLYE